MYEILRLTENGFTVFAILFYTGGPLTVILSGGRSEGLVTVTPDFTLIKLIFQLIYIITIFYLVPHWRRATYLLIKDKLILLLMIIIFLSILWSVDTGQTVARSVAVFGTTLFGVYLATRYSLKQQLYLLGWGFGLASIMSVLFAVALPQYGIMQGVHAGAWRGIYTHKNGLGAIMSFSAITFITLLSEASNRRKKWIFRAGFFISVLLLLLSRSSSPLIYLLVLILVFFVSNFLGWKYKLKAVAVSSFAAYGYILAIWLVSQTEAVVNLFGKDLTLTGRTELWACVWELIQKRPWLGYGYSALWSSLNSETITVWKRVHWEAPNAHNGFLEIWLGLGLLGLSVLGIHVVTNFIRILTLIGRTRIVVYPLMVILYNLLSSTTESGFVDRNSINWILYVSMLLSLKLTSNIRENASF